MESQVGVQRKKITTMLFLACVFALISAIACQGEIYSGSCGKRNAYYKIAGDCDSYIECIEYKQYQRLCPDGMHYNTEAPWPTYPCGYPMDVPCGVNDVPQVARSNSECPNLYGFFASPLSTRTDCGKYRMCVGGIAKEMQCADGLAFNPESGRCDWPALVPACDAEAFLGYTCPPGSVDEDGYDIVENFPLTGECQVFISCYRGGARRLRCDAGFNFDPSVNRCVDSDIYTC